MHVLVIGGTGLISTGITRGLVAAGHDVTCFTRGETDASVPDPVEFVHGDRDDERFAKQVGALDIDRVIDMVCFSPEQADRAVDAFAGDIDQYVSCSTVDVYHRPAERIRSPRTRRANQRQSVRRGQSRRRGPIRGHPRQGVRDDRDPTVEHLQRGRDVLHSLGTNTRYIEQVRTGEPMWSTATGHPFGNRATA